MKEYQGYIDDVFKKSITNPYLEKKKKTRKLVEYSKSFVSYKVHQRIDRCGSWLRFVSNSEFTVSRLLQADFCTNRFCPMCAWRKSLKDASMLSFICKHILEIEKKSFIFLTLTTPNVTGINLKSEIDRFNKAFKKLMARKQIKAMNYGYIRKLEVTYNSKRDDYNPHFHVMICVDKSYKNNKKKYIPHATWLDLWQQSLKDTTVKIVNVKNVSADRQGSIEKSVLEIVKYSVKDSDYLLNEGVFSIFYKALKGCQLVTYSGIFKRLLQFFEQADFDSDDDTLYEFLYNSIYSDTDYLTKVYKFAPVTYKELLNNIREQRGFNLI